MAVATSGKRTSLQRLCRSMEADRQALEDGRANMVDAVRELAGHRWSEQAAEKAVHCNLMDLWTRAMVSNLCPKSPRFMLSSWDRRLEPVLAATQEWAGQEAERQRLDLVFQDVVLNALYYHGVAKVGLTHPAEAAQSGWRRRPGVAYIGSVDPDDHVYDTSARRHEEVAYEGHRLRLPLEYVKSSKLYKAKARAALEPMSFPERYNEEGDERLSRLSVGDYGYDSGPEDVVECWEVYLPRSRRVLLLAASGSGGVPTGEPDCVLRDEEYFGPDEGPFHWLCLGRVPGNLRPKAPAMDLVDLHKALNRLQRKLLEQAYRQKQVFLASDPDDANAVNTAADGTTVYAKRSAGQDAVQERRFSGPDAQNFQMFDYLRNQFDQLAGNLSVLLGLRSLAGTAKQEGIMDQNAAKSLQHYQELCSTFYSRAGRAWLWYEWNSPVRHMRSTWRAPFGLAEFDRERTVYPNVRRNRDDPARAGMTRTAPFNAFQVKVDPYSMQPSSPQQKARELMEMMQGVVMPGMGLFAEQGKVPDVNFFFDRIARYRDNPDIARLMNVAEPPSVQAARQEGGAGGDGARMAMGTTRNYVRRSESGGGGDAGGLGDADAVSNMMAAQNSQRSQG